MFHSQGAPDLSRAAAATSWRPTTLGPAEAGAGDGSPPADGCADFRARQAAAGAVAAELPGAAAPGTEREVADHWRGTLLSRASA